MEIQFILEYQASPEILTQRLLGRALTSGRADDNAETIKNRIAVFFANTTPTLALYHTFGKVYQIDALGTIEQVHHYTL